MGFWLPLSVCWAYGFNSEGIMECSITTIMILIFVKGLVITRALNARKVMGTSPSNSPSVNIFISISFIHFDTIKSWIRVRLWMCLKPNPYQSPCLKARMTHGMRTIGRQWLNIEDKSNKYRYSLKYSRWLKMMWWHNRQGF